MEGIKVDLLDLIDNKRVSIPVKVFVKIIDRLKDTTDIRHPVDVEGEIKKCIEHLELFLDENDN